MGTAPDKTDQMGLAYSTDLTTGRRPRQAGAATPSRTVRLPGRRAGPAPILTPGGIVLIYNGADDKLVYRTGVARFDRKDPRRLLSRTDAPIFAPETPWEKTGQVPNVVFVEGMVRQGARWLLYYGGADKVIGVAEAPVR